MPGGPGGDVPVHPGPDRCFHRQARLQATRHSL
jgi:hypothetical protein